MGRIKISDLRDLELQMLKGEITYGRMVELLNEIANPPVVSGELHVPHK